MQRIDIPERGTIELQHAVFDINGTLAVDGVLLPGVLDRLDELARLVSITILTAGTHGNIDELKSMLKYPFHVISKGEEKEQFVRKLGAANVIAFGNGANDAGMLRAAAIGVAVITSEGLASSALQAADVVAQGPVYAIELVLQPIRLVATLRG